MNDRQIECFLEAGRLLNFTKAAQNLTLPQPAVSRYISSLESELGVSLFVRESNRKVVLSEAGKTYFNLFQRFSLELSHTRALMAESSPALRLGYNVGWDISPFLPQVLSRCLERDPRFRVSLECLGFRELVRGLGEKRLDAVLSTESYLTREPDLETQRLVSIRRVVVYSDLLKDAGHIADLSDFYPYDFFIVDDPRVRQICSEAEDLFHPYHFVPKFVPMPNLDTVFAYVENGLGVALLDGWYSSLSSPKIHALPLDDRLPIALAWRAGTAAASIEILREELVRQFQS